MFFFVFFFVCFGKFLNKKFHSPTVFWVRSDREVVRSLPVSKRTKRRRQEGWDPGGQKKKQNPKQKDTRTPKLKEKNHANPPQPAVNPLKNPMAPRYESLLPRKVRYNVIQFDLKPFETDRIIEKSLWFFRKIQENPGKPSKTQ